MGNDVKSAIQKNGPMMHEMGSALKGKWLYNFSLGIQSRMGWKEWRYPRYSMMFYINIINLSVGPVQPLCLWILLDSKKPTNFLLNFRFCGKLVQFTISFLFDSRKDSRSQKSWLTQMLHVWNIYLDLRQKWPKCRQIYHTWSIWVRQLGPASLRTICM